MSWLALSGLRTNWAELLDEVAVLLVEDVVLLDEWEEDADDEEEEDDEDEEDEEDDEDDEEEEECIDEELDVTELVDR